MRCPRILPFLLLGFSLMYGQARFEDLGDHFTSRGARHRLALYDAGASEFLVAGSTIRTRLLGARRVTPKGQCLLPGQSNSLVTNLEATGIAAYERVHYAGVYPGVDLSYYGHDGEIEYDFVIAPNGDYRQIRLDIAAGTIPRLDHGDLLIGPSGVRWHRPIAYQKDSGGNRQIVASRFVVKGSQVSFHLASYDHSRELVIDPTLNYLSYSGGSGNDAARGIALDTQGNIYIAGYTTSENLPGTGSTVQSTYGGGIPSHQSTGDAYIAKYSPAGALIYMTYFGGSADDVAIGVAVDAQGSPYITGYTNSANFKTTAGAVQPSFGGQGRNSGYHEGGDAFVVKLNPAGNQIMYSTYVGGSRDDRGIAIALDAQGNAYITGNTISSNFPVTAGAFQSAYGGGQATDIYDGGDAFVTKLNPTGSQIIFSTYLGGSGNDLGGSIAVDSTGVYIGGKTTSSNFPVSASAFQRTYGGASDDNAQPVFKGGDGFIAKLNPTGTALVYSTYLGGRADDSVASIAVDTSGAVYATGATASANFPVTASAAKKTFGGPAAANGYLLFGDGFVVKLNPAGSALAYATYFGGTGDEIGWAIAIDAAGNAYVGGQTNSSDLAVTSDALQKTFGGRGGQSQAVGDGIFLKVDPTGSQFLYMTYLGGNGDDAIGGIALDIAGNAYVTGSTASSNLPVSSAAAQKVYGGRNNAGLLVGDAFLAKITDLSPAAEPDVKLAAVANAASYGAGTVAPGEIVILYGAKIGPATLTKAGVTASGLLDNSTAQTQILFDGVPAPIVYVSATQSAAIVPYSVAGKASTQVQVSYQGTKSLPLTVKVADAAPGLFAADSTGVGPGAIYNQDNSLNAPTNPASEGQIIVLFGTGEGQTIPAGVDGRVAADVYPKPSLPVTVTVGGQPATDILYYGAIPFQVAGLFQVNVRVPPGAGAGNQEVIVKVGTVESQKKLTVSLK